MVTREHIQWYLSHNTPSTYRKNPKDLEIKQFVGIILKSEQGGFTIHLGFQKMQLEWQIV